MDNKKTAQWFGNGLLDFPPAKDVFLEVSPVPSRNSVRNDGWADALPSLSHHSFPLAGQFMARSLATVA